MRLFEFYAGPYYALKGVLHALTGADLGKDIGPVLRLVFLLAALAIAVRAWRASWPLHRTAFWISASLVLTSTTVHPWYLLTPAALLTLHTTAPRAVWAFVAVLAFGATMTHAYYRGVPMDGLVLIGWGGACLAALLVHVAPRGLERLMRARADGKVRALAPWLPQRLDGLRVLDLGAGEGYVGDALGRRGAEVTLADVVDSGAVALPFVRIDDEAPLPFADDAFDVVLLVFVLHHARDPNALIAEAHRVGRCVVVLESVYERPWERWVLERLDRLANGLRGGWMDEQPVSLKMASEWRTIIEQRTGCTSKVHRRGRPPHRQAVLSW